MSDHHNKKTVVIFKERMCSKNKQPCRVKVKGMARSEWRSRTKNRNIRCRYLQNVLPHHPCNPYFLKTRLHKRNMCKLCNRREKQSFTAKKNSFSFTLCYGKRFFGVRCLQRFSAVPLSDCGLRKQFLLSLHQRGTI